jgi:TATA-binding protein-associated factor Taf7
MWWGTLVCSRHTEQAVDALKSQLDAWAIASDLERQLAEVEQVDAAKHPDREMSLREKEEEAIAKRLCEKIEGVRNSIAQALQKTNSILSPVRSSRFFRQMNIIEAERQGVQLDEGDA